jgi:CelD/BcsL family acetyltransferase involved in cellulose biosynthesis
MVAPEAQSLRVIVRSNRDEIGELAPQWLELCRRSEGVTPFQRPEWLLAWIDAFTPRELFAVEVRDDQRLVGLALLLIYPRGEQRVLAFAGGGVSDYLGWICERGREADLLQAVATSIEGDWDVLDLTDLHANSEIVKLFSLEPYVNEHDFCSVLDLPETQSELLQLFSKRQRANLRNARSRLERAGGGQFEAATPENLSEFLDDLFRLHTMRWSQAGEAGVLHDERVQLFHRMCAPALHSQGILKLHRMRVNGRTAGVLHSLWNGGTVFCYLHGFDPAYAALSPGTQLIFTAMREAVSCGMRRFDFLRGQEAYKQHWRSQPCPTFRVTLTRERLQQALRSTRASNAA